MVVVLQKLRPLQTGSLAATKLRLPALSNLALVRKTASLAVLKTKPLKKAKRKKRSKQHLRKSAIKHVLSALPAQRSGANNLRVDIPFKSLLCGGFFYAHHQQLPATNYHQPTINCFSAISATCSPMARAAVAAGEGALRT